VKRVALLRHLRRYGCVLIREGARHSYWQNPDTGALEAVPPYGDSEEPRRLDLEAVVGSG
jgi:mRNA interferase HicA